VSIHDSNVQQYLRSQFASPQGKLAVKKTRIARIQEMMWVLAIIPALHPPPFTKKKKCGKGGKPIFGSCVQVFEQFLVGQKDRISFLYYPPEGTEFISEIYIFFNVYEELR